MSYETISISVDAELKMKAGKILNDLGLDLETAITMFLQSVVRCGGMPFDTEEAEQEEEEEKEKEEPNAETRAALGEYRAMKEHPELYRRYDSVNDAVSDVLSGE